MSNVLRVEAIQAVFMTRSGTRRVAQVDCVKMRDGQEAVFVMPEAPAQSDNVQFIMALGIGDGGVCMTMWSASQPIRDGKLFLEGLRK